MHVHTRLTLALAAAVFFVGNPGVVAQDGLGGIEAPCDPPHDGTWAIQGLATRVVCQDRTIQVRNLTVHAGAELVLERVELVINSTSHGSNGSDGSNMILVWESLDRWGGGSLQIRDSYIRPWDNTYDYEFRAHAGTIMRIENTTIDGSYGIWVPVVGSDVQEFTVRGSRFINNTGTPIALGAATFAGGMQTGHGGPESVWIEDNFLDRPVNKGINVIGQPKSIQNNTIVDCQTREYSSAGVNLQWPGSAPQVFRDNTITACKHGMRASSGACEESVAYRDNDIYANGYDRLHGTVHNGATNGAPQAAICGDLNSNWLDLDRWDGQALPEYQFNHVGFNRGVPPTQWDSQPNHPERLPKPVVAGVPATVSVGDAVVFDASQSQPSQEFGFPLESYTWTFGDCTLATSGPVVSHTYATPGHHWAELFVQDDHGLGRSWRQVIAVQDENGQVPGAPPTRTFNDNGYVSAGIDEKTPQRGGPVLEALRARSDDRDDSSFSFWWSWFHDGVHQPDLDNVTVVPGHRMVEGDEWTLRVQACDGRHRALEDGRSEGTDTFVFEISKAIDQTGPVNQVPVIDALEIQPDDPPSPVDLEAVASFHDPEGDHVWLDYEWKRNGVVQASLTSATVPSAFVQSGDRWSVTVTARDWEDSTTETASVLVESALGITDVAIDPAQPVPGDGLQVSWSPVGAERHEVQASYAWSRNGAPQTGLTGDTVPGSQVQAHDEWSVAVILEDAAGNQAAGAADILVANRLPTVDTVTLQPTSPRKGDDLQATVSASDPDGDPVTLTYAWTRNGQPASVTTATVGGALIEKGDEWQLAANPNDGYDDGAPVQSQAVTVQNTPPAATASLPGAPRADGDLQATATGQDVDGDAVALSYAWSKNGIQQADLTTALVPSSRLVKGDAWSVTITPHDGDEAGQAASAEATIQNSPPAITSLTISPEEPSAGDELQATVTTADADDDAVALTYAWTKNDVSQPDLTGPAVPGERVAAGDTWIVGVTPSDGEDAGDAAEAHVSVDNRSPVIDVLDLLPVDPTAETPLQADASASDPDGDPVTFSYEWKRDGAVQSYTGNQVPTSALSKGQEWTVVVTASDGSLNAQESRSVVIANIPPRITSIHITPTNPTADQALGVSVEAVDVDDDAITYTYGWSQNGVLQGDVTEDTVSASRVAAGDVWSVSVVPSDGEAAGEAMEVTATIPQADNGGSAPPANQAPVVESMGLQPEAPTAGTPLEAAPSVSDPDGDAIDVDLVWYLNGQATDLTGSTVPGDRVHKGQSWRYTATASDGQASVVEESPTVVVQNTPPTVEAAAAQPEAPVAGQEVTLFLDAADLDGDTLQIEWTLPDDTTLSGTSATTSLPVGTHSIQYTVTDGDETVTGKLDLDVLQDASTDVTNDAGDASQTDSTQSEENALFEAQADSHDAPAPAAMLVILVIGLACARKRNPRP